MERGGAAAGSSHQSGVWTGQEFEVVGDIPRAPTSLLWVLTLVADAPYPSACGAAAITVSATDPAPSSSEASGCTLCVLHGTWEGPSRGLRMTRMANGPARNIRVYQGALQRDGDVLWLRGQWTEDNGRRRGQFVCCKEPDDGGAYVAGLWLGQAAPDASLADFFIPTNPIRWTLAMLHSPPHGIPSAFGVGYFDDSADVPNRPLLFFTLRGSWQRDVAAGNAPVTGGHVELQKVYEAAAETVGYEVLYDGRLELQPDDSSSWLRGTWRNPKGGSFGSFTARRQQSSESVTSAIYLCDVCGQPIKPGEVRWNCATCLQAQQFCVCAGCAVGSTHPHPLVPEALYRQETAAGACCAEIIQDAFRRFAPRPFIGTRRPTDPQFHYMSYGEVGAVVESVAFGLRELSVPARSCALLCADLSLPLLTTSLGALLAGCILVPVHGSLEDAALEHILRRTTPTVVIVSEQYAEKMRRALNAVGFADSLQLVRLGDSLPTAVGGGEEGGEGGGEGKGKAKGKKEATLAELLASGNRARAAAAEPFPVARLALGAVSAVLFTSGSTGVPKGAVFNEELMMPSEGVATVQPFIRFDFQAYDPSFVLSVLQTMLCGGRRLFTSGLVSLMQDFEIGRPTHVGATPALWNALYQDYLSRVAKLLAAAVTTAKDRTTRADAEQRVADELRRSLGNRLVVASSGGAPLSPEVLNFARTKLRIDIVDLYGSRETGGIARDGVIYKAIDVKLLSVPELGYDANGTPPRGEICVFSPRLIPGYWNDPELTANSFVEIGGRRYYRTGDVGEFIPDNQAGASAGANAGGGNAERPMRLRVIDRVGAVVKLSQGEWVAPARVEAVLEECPAVSQALVMASSSQRSTVAVVVPSAAFDGNRERLLDMLRLWCVQRRLRPFEIPQALHVEPERWTPENGFLTSTDKKRRGPLQARYAATRDALYASLTTQASAAAGSPPSQSGEKLSEEGEGSFGAMLRTVLPPGVVLSSQATFGQIGGDSLAAARLAVALRARGVDADERALFEFPLSHWAQLLQLASAGVAAPPRSSVAAVVDWASECALPSSLASEGQQQPNRSGGDVFVTGCTGFLGPVLVAEILSQFPASTAVYCLVRARSPADAAARLRADMERASVWPSDAAVAARLRPLAGDLASADDAFGLPSEIYSELKSRVADIFHSGASVNMALPYVALRVANVDGTVRVIRLALAARARLHYVSTVAAVPGGDVSAGGEDWIPPAVALQPAAMAAKDGYGQTKVVAEQLLRAAKEQYGLEVRCVRPSAICGHTVSGFSNRLDFASLLLRACKLVNAAVLDTSVLLHWIPVDFVAKAIVALARDPRSAGGVFHLTADGPRLSQVLRQLSTLRPSLTNVSAEDWKRRLVTRVDEREPQLFALRDSLAGFQWNAPPSPSLPTARTRAALAALGIEWLPPTVLTAEQLDRCLANLFPTPQH